MLNQIAQLLLVNAFGLLVYALLLRFYMQVLRAPFRNPVGQLVAALTNWIVIPARRAIPGLAGIDLATILVAWIVQALMLTLMFWLSGKPLIATAMGAAAGLLFGLAAIELLQASLYLLIGVVIVHVLLGWFNPHTPLAPIFDALTRPFYGLFRRFIPPIGNVDFSPLLVVIVAQVLLIPIGTLVRMIEGPF